MQRDWIFHTGRYFLGSLVKQKKKKRERAVEWGGKKLCLHFADKTSEVI